MLYLFSKNYDGYLSRVKCDAKDCFYRHTKPFNWLKKGGQVKSSSSNKFERQKSRTFFNSNFLPRPTFVQVQIDLGIGKLVLKRNTQKILFENQNLWLIDFTVWPGVRLSLQFGDKKGEIWTFVFGLFSDFLGFLWVLKGHIVRIVLQNNKPFPVF